ADSILHAGHALREHRVVIGGEAGLLRLRRGGNQEQRDANTDRVFHPHRNLGWKRVLKRQEPLQWGVMRATSQRALEKYSRWINSPMVSAVTARQAQLETNQATMGMAK